MWGGIEFEIFAGFDTLEVETSDLGGSIGVCEEIEGLLKAIGSMSGIVDCGRASSRVTCAPNRRRCYNDAQDAIRALFENTSPRVYCNVPLTA